jgi:carbamoyl-phosphate synthase large subunit
MEIDTIQELTSFDPWFLAQIKNIVAEERIIADTKKIEDRRLLVKWKKMGFCDQRIAKLSGIHEDLIKSFRYEKNIHPVYKTIDTCAGEFASYTPYLYSSYMDDGFNPSECEANVTTNHKVVILGGGANRIGQGIEFDYACCHAALELRKSGIETIMVNCNPETVSTDYNISDKLYFEPLYYEDVIELIHQENTNGHLLGVIVQLGGQTPLKLAHYLDKAGIKILGTSLDNIDLAEDRGRFKELLAQLDILQPDNAICQTLGEVKPLCDQIGYPVIIRPSNVLGGRGMAILENGDELDRYLAINKENIVDGTILVDKFLANALELDVDAICDGDCVYIAGVMEQIERAGVHSGDSACILPPLHLSSEILMQVKDKTTAIAIALKVHGLLNIQYAIKENKVYVLEVNPRASRTVPFVAKATKVPLISIMVQILLGTKLKDLEILPLQNNIYAVKEVFAP